MKLGGWFRLWIVLIVVYGILIIAVSYETKPSLSYIEYRWVTEATDVIAEKISEAEGQEIYSYKIKDILFKDRTNNEIIDSLRKIVETPSEGQKIFSTQVAAINERFEKELDELPSKQNNHYLQSLLWWLIPSIALLILGWSIGWVIRGFKQAKH